MYRAIRKYGKECFSYLVIEEVKTREEADIREIEFISKYGYYNISEGGSYTIDLSILSDSEATEIRSLLSLGNMKYSEIGRKYNIATTLISNINFGNRYFDPTVSYPIRDNSWKPAEDYSELISLLASTQISFSKIAKRVGVSESSVKKINYGKMRTDLWDKEYPIRKDKVDIAVKKMLVNTDLSYSKIAEKTGVSRQTVSRINNGLTYKDKNIQYPIRNL